MPITLQFVGLSGDRRARRSNSGNLAPYGPWSWPFAAFPGARGASAGDQGAPGRAVLLGSEGLAEDFGRMPGRVLCGPERAEASVTGGHGRGRRGAPADPCDPRTGAGLADVRGCCRARARGPCEPCSGGALWGGHLGFVPAHQCGRRGRRGTGSARRAGACRSGLPRGEQRGGAGADARRGGLAGCRARARGRRRAAIDPAALSDVRLTSADGAVLATAHFQSGHLRTGLPK